MRRPSVHLFIEDLAKIVDEKTVKKIVEASKLNPVKRSLLVANVSQAKKINKINTEGVGMFNRFLEASRMERNHKAIITIMEGDRNYDTLCKVTSNANEFCRHYELPEEIGYKIYCDIGLKKIGRNYGINKFITYNEYIFLAYEKVLAVKGDKNKDTTKELVAHYAKNISIHNDKQLKALKKEYMHDFVYASEQLVSVGASAIGWVDAQFKGLEYLEVLPKPYQLHGEEAMKRFVTHGSKGESSRERLRRKLNKSK